MVYDVLLIVVIIVWSLVKIIDKHLIKNLSPNEFTKWVFLFNFIFALPIIFFVKIPTLIVLIVLVIISLTTVFSQFFLYKGTKIDEISRITPFQQFSILFAIMLSYLFLNEQLSLVQYLGIFAMFTGGFLISIEKPFKDINKLIFHNRAVLLVLLSAFLGGLNIFVNKLLLNVYLTVFTLSFFRNLISVAIVLPIKNIKISNWYLFLLARAFSTYGYLLFYFVLSKQQLSLTVPILAVQPLVVALLSKHLLKEELKMFRSIGILAIILGYILLQI